MTSYELDVHDTIPRFNTVILSTFMSRLFPRVHCAPCTPVMNQELIMPAVEVEQPPKCKVKNTRALIFLALYTFMVYAYDIDNYISLLFILPDLHITRVIQNSQTDYKPII
jgi:hypothetical protein